MTTEPSPAVPHSSFEEWNNAKPDQWMIDAMDAINVERYTLMESEGRELTASHGAGIMARHQLSAKHAAITAAMSAGKEGAK